MQKDTERVLSIEGPVILLMGPIGTFFGRLSWYLHSKGVKVIKVQFPLVEIGDFSNNYVKFGKGQEIQSFGVFLTELVEEHKARHIFMYGEAITHHKMALQYEREKCLGNAKCHVFELGYLRPNYVTLEDGGVNYNSKLYIKPEELGSLRDPLFIQSARRESFLRWRKVLKAPCFIQHAFCNYSVCETSHKLNPKPIYIWYQILGFARRQVSKTKEKKIIRGLMNEERFFLLVLQVSTDTQMTDGSGYDSVEEVIEEVIDSFGENCEDAKLYIKHHPRDRGYNDYGRLVAKLSIQKRCRGRVVYFHDSGMANILTAKGCAGVITVNSSVGFQSLYHGVPTLALGQAIYNILGVCDQNCLDSFWKSPTKPRRELVRRLFAHVISQSQINGSLDGYFPFERTFRIADGAAIHPAKRRRAGRLRKEFKNGARLIYFVAIMSAVYIAYLVHWLYAWLGQNEKSRHIFEKSARIAMFAMRVDVRCNAIEDLAEKGCEIHIANHTSPLDILFVHGYMKMPAATTSHNYLGVLLPGVEKAMRKYGHMPLRHTELSSRFSILKKSLKNLRSRKKLFVFPSGSLQTSITERVNDSVGYIGMQTNAEIVAWHLEYIRDDGETVASTEKDPFKVLVSRLRDSRLTLVARQIGRIRPEEYKTRKDLNREIKALYCSQS